MFNPCNRARTRGVTPPCLAGVQAFVCVCAGTVYDCPCGVSYWFDKSWFLTEKIPCATILHHPSSLGKPNTITSSINHDSKFLSAQPLYCRQQSFTFSHLTLCCLPQTLYNYCCNYQFFRHYGILRRGGTGEGQASVLGAHGRTWGNWSRRSFSLGLE